MDLRDLTVHLCLGGCPLLLCVCCRPLFLLLPQLLEGRCLLHRRPQGLRCQFSGFQVLLQLGGVIVRPPGVELLHGGDGLSGDGVFQVGPGEEGGHIRLGLLPLFGQSLFHGGLDGRLLLLLPPAPGIFRPLLLGLLGGLTAAVLRGLFLLPGSAAVLVLRLLLFLGELLALRRLLGAARSGLRALFLYLCSRFGGLRVVSAFFGLFQPKRLVQVVLFKTGHIASYPANGR